MQYTVHRGKSCLTWFEEKGIPRCAELSVVRRNVSCHKGTTEEKAVAGKFSEKEKGRGEERADNPPTEAGCWNAMRTIMHVAGTAGRQTAPHTCVCHIPPFSANAAFTLASMSVLDGSKT